MIHEWFLEHLIPAKGAAKLRFFPITNGLKLDTTHSSGVSQSPGGTMVRFADGGTILMQTHDRRQILLRDFPETDDEHQGHVDVYELVPNDLPRLLGSATESNAAEDIPLLGSNSQLIYDARKPRSGR